MAENRRLFISCEHGGNRVPPQYQGLFLCQEDRLNSHYGYDLGALPLASMLAKGTAAPLHKSETTRLLVDLNRSLNNPNLFSDLTQNVEQFEKEQILENYYLPYRSRVTDKINDLIACGAQVIHLSIHTFTPILHGKIRNAEIGLLYDPKRREEKLFSHSWQQLLNQQLPGMRVRCNYPYRGTADGLVKELRLNLSPQDYVGIELEINQALLTGKNQFPQPLQYSLLSTLKELLSTD